MLCLGAYDPKPLTTAKGGTGLTSPGTAGNVLTSNGTIWTSAAPAGFDPANTYFLASSGGDYSTLSAAITAINAMSGTQPIALYIFPGSWAGGLTITRQNVHLIGASRKGCVINSSIVAAFGTPYPVTGTLDIRADNCSLQNLTVSNSVATAAQISLALIVGNTTGVGVPTAADFRAINCDFIAPSTTRDTVFIMSTATDTVIEGCYIEGGTDVLSVSGVNTLVRNCHIYGNSTHSAIYTAETHAGVSTTTHIYDCVFENVAFGFTLDNNTVYAAGNTMNGVGIDNPYLWYEDSANEAAEVYATNNTGFKIKEVQYGTVAQYPLRQDPTASLVVRGITSAAAAGGEDAEPAEHIVLDAADGGAGDGDGAGGAGGDVQVTAGTGGANGGAGAGADGKIKLQSNVEVASGKTLTPLGGLKRPTSTKVANYTLAATDYCVVMDTGTAGGDLDVALPLASGLLGQEFIIVNRGADYVVTFTNSGSDAVMQNGSLVAGGSGIGPDAAVHLIAVASGLWVVAP